MARGGWTRRRFVLGAGGAGMVILLAACGQQSTASQGSSSSASASTAAPTAAASTQSGAQPTAAPKASSQSTGSGPVTIVMHNWLEDPKNTFWGPTIANFEKANPNIKIKKEWFPRSDLHTKELALAATGQIGDIVRVNVAPLIAELRLKNVVQALDSYIKADKQWNDKDQPQFWPGNIQTYSAVGQQWGYPMVGHPGDIHYFFNIDQLDKTKAGMPPLDVEKLTFDYSKWKQADLLEILPKAQSVGSDGRVSVYGIQPGLGAEGTVAVLRSFGGNYYNDQGTKCLINTKESIEGLQYLSDYWNKLKVAIPLQTNPNYAQTFPNGRVSFVVLTALVLQVQDLVKNKFKWALVPAPLGPVGKPVSQVSSDGIAMSKITKHPQQAWAVLKMCLSENFGVERFLAGLGSPGSRYDVWTDPRIKKAAPLLATVIYDNLINPKTAPPLMPWSHPANGRFNEADTAMTNILQDVYLGKKSATQGANDAYKTVQAIMDKPPA